MRTIGKKEQKGRPSSDNIISEKMEVIKEGQPVFPSLKQGKAHCLAAWGTLGDTWSHSNDKGKNDMTIESCVVRINTNGGWSKPTRVGQGPFAREHYESERGLHVKVSVA